VVDLDVFTGESPASSTPRDLSDIIFITDSFSRVMGKHVRNIVPVTTYGGSKKDFTMISLGRYLRQSFSLNPPAPKSAGKGPQPVLVKDVRDKI
jgi:hypothetical protein